MKVQTIICLITFVIFIGCSINNIEDSNPEFIEELYLKEQLSDTVGLDSYINITEASNDSLYIEFFITNEKNTDTIIIHSGNFANIAVYNNSELIYPAFDPNKMIYWDDYNELRIPTQDQVRIGAKMVHVPVSADTKVIGFAPLDLKETNTQDSSGTNKFWLISTPKMVK